MIQYLHLHKINILGYVGAALSGAVNFIVTLSTDPAQVNSLVSFAGLVLPAHTVQLVSAGLAVAGAVAAAYKPKPKA